MTLVVADTAPLRYLVQIGYEYFICRPNSLRRFGFLAPLPKSCDGKRRPPFAIGPSNSHHELRFEKSRRLLIDDRPGARVARARGFRVTGTLGVLIEAA